PLGSVVYGPSKIARSTSPVAEMLNVSPDVAKSPVAVQPTFADTVTGTACAGTAISAVKARLATTVAHRDFMDVLTSTTTVADKTPSRALKFRIRLSLTESEPGIP